MKVKTWQTVVLQYGELRAKFGWPTVSNVAEVMKPRRETG